ncbi:MAG: PSD1 and planctomycete cytochrome C domain-containing protein [Isosphaeraceae bacterium]
MDRKTLSLVTTLTLVLSPWASPALAAVDDAQAAAEKVEFFESKVRPLLVEHCQGCHGSEKQKSNLRLDSLSGVLKGGDSGPAIEPGSPDTSLLIEAIAYEGATQMPPKGKLKPQAIAALTDWVRLGAPWPDEAPRSATEVKANAGGKDPSEHWAFQPLVDPPIPEVRDQAWPRSPIDHFILSKLESRGLQPVGPADRLVLLRRVTFDLTGLPPSPEETAAFLADESPDAFERVVDRLLSSPRYGERWGRHWLDVARYGEDQAHTFEARKYPYGYRYRDWVVQALNQDMPYDQFVIEQIAGDQLEGPDKDRRLAALGFFALGPVYYGKAIADERDDRIDTLTRGFLGLTVACARCHDHKFDPIPTRDYYSLAGIFASTEYKEYPAAPAEVVARYDEAQAAIKSKTAEAEAFVPLTALHPYFVIPKDQAERFLSAEAKTALKGIKAEAARLKKSAPPPYPVIHGLTDSQAPSDLKVAIRGNPDAPGEIAPRRFLSILSKGSASPFQEGSGRHELAREIVRPDNPLTARVIVNRIWDRHFGRGIVATPSNFGTLGDPPSHPELLDWLASRFLSLGWSMKAIHREILLSATYRQSSRIIDRNQEIDPENLLLWRQNRRRLEVEAWRDAMLAVSGTLETSIGGPSQDLSSSDNRRRTLYAAVSRHNLDNLLRLFDYPDPNITCDRRSVTTVPLQQLFVLNSDFMAKQAEALAQRLTSDPDLTDEERVRQAFPILFARPADEEEVRLALEFLKGEGASATSSESGGDPWNASDPARRLGWRQYAQVLLGSNEFLYVD